MSQSSIMLTTQKIPLDELKSQLRDEVKTIVQECLKQEQSEQLLSPSMVCELFKPKLSKTTLAKYTREGKFISYNVCGRILYKYGTA